MTKTKSSQFYSERFTSKLTELNKIEDYEALDINQVTDFLAVHENLTENKPIISNFGKTEAIIGLDCEMVGTVSDDMALARLSAVDIKGDCIIDILIHPHPDISFVEDFRTHITGLEKKHFYPASSSPAVSFDFALRILATKISKQTFIVGHAVDHDLLALKLNHDRVIDSALLFPVVSMATGSLSDELTHSLEYLCEVVLGETMDRSSRLGVHDSIEDAAKSLKLIEFLYRCNLQKLDLKPIVQRPTFKMRKQGFKNSISYAVKYLKSQEGKKEDPPQTIIQTMKPTTSRFTEGFKSYMNLLQNSAHKTKPRVSRLASLRKKK